MAANLLALSAPGWRAQFAVRHTVWTPSRTPGWLYPLAELDTAGSVSPLWLLVGAGALAGAVQAAVAITGDARLVWLDIGLSAPLTAVAVGALQSHVVDLEAAVAQMMCTALVVAIFALAALEGPRSSAHALMPIAAAAWLLQLLHIAVGEVARPAGLPPWMWVAIGLHHALLAGAGTVAAAGRPDACECAASWSLLTRLTLASVMSAMCTPAGHPTVVAASVPLALPTATVALLALHAVVHRNGPTPEPDGQRPPAAARASVR